MKFSYRGKKYKLILFTLAGSRFYGTHYEKGEHPFYPDYQSDSDYRGVFVADVSEKIGLGQPIEDIEIKKNASGQLDDASKEFIEQLNSKLGLKMPFDTDLVLFEARKFVRLALDNNPNIMDILFTDGDAIVYTSKRGKDLLKNRNLFISKKMMHTFSGYASQQLSRVKGHNKHITKYPKTGAVLDALKKAYSTGDINYVWITDNFSGEVAEFVTGLNQSAAQLIKNKKSMSWKEFVNKYGQNTCSVLAGLDYMDYSDEQRKSFLNATVFYSEWEHYRKPQLIHYVHPKDLKAHPIKMSDLVYVGADPFIANGGSCTMGHFLKTFASFRTISKTQYAIFTSVGAEYKGGIFARNGDIKKNDPENVGEFVCLLSIDDLNYKSDTDAYNKMWNWRVNRNQNRSILEDKFGYDTKHCSHLFRLLLGAKNVLVSGEYQPRLSGNNLKLVKDVLNGKYSYEWILEQSVALNNELKSIYTDSVLRETPDQSAAEQLLLKISK